VFYGIESPILAGNPLDRVRFRPPPQPKSVGTLRYRNIATVLIEVFMDHSSKQLPEFANGGTEAGNQLWNYVQSLTPEAVAQLSRPTSAEAFQVMERNIVGLLGGLPSEHFNVMISTSREDLGRLLASAMMSGYFIRNAEQRLTFEKSLTAAESDSSEAQ
jgi:hypothetical protein